MKRVFALGLIAFGILLTMGAMFWAYFDASVNRAENAPLPNSIAGMQLTNSTRGSQAIVEFEHLHNADFPVTSGAIGVYGNQKITLWVAGTPSESTALELTSAMQARIAEGNSLFKPINEVNAQGHRVYVLEGMGQKHYYFRSKNLVIWLASEPELADAALQQILEVYP